MTANQWNGITENSIRLFDAGQKEKAVEVVMSGLEEHATDDQLVKIKGLLPMITHAGLREILTLVCVDRGI